MDKTLKKTVALLLFTAFMFQFAGCSKDEESVEETTRTEEEETTFDEDDILTDAAVIAAAENFAEAVWTCDTDEFAELCSADYIDIQNDLEEQLNFYWLNPGEGDDIKVFQAIIDNMRYEVDTDSVDLDEDDETATVEVSFELPDYESIMEDEFIQSADDFAQEASVTYSAPLVIELEFELDDDVWICTNFQEVFDVVYAFTDMEIDFETVTVDVAPNGALDITLRTDHLDWWGICNDDQYAPEYLNTNEITCQLMIEEETADVTGLRAELSVGGNVLCVQEDYTFVSFDELDVPDAYRVQDPETYDYYFATGMYTVTFYNTDGTVLISTDVSVRCDLSQTGMQVVFMDLYSEDDVLYANPTEISAALREGQSWVVLVGGSAIVEYKGEIILEITDISSDSVSFAAGDPDIPVDPSGNYLAEGEYTITFYDYTGEPVASGTCTVDVV